MDVKFLHDGTPVVVLAEGSGEPGEWNGTGASAAWVDNPDYRPAKVVRLIGATGVEEMEQGQMVGSLEDTSSYARAQAIEAGDHPNRDDTQYVHDPATRETATSEQPADVLEEGRDTADTSWEEQATAAGWSRGGTPVVDQPTPAGVGADASTQVGAAERHTSS